MSGSVLIAALGVLTLSTAVTSAAGGEGSCRVLASGGVSPLLPTGCCEKVF